MRLARPGRETGTCSHIPDVRRLALIPCVALAAACGGSSLDGAKQTPPDQRAVGSWDLVRARAEASSVLPFACETATDKTSWPCIAGAITDTIMAGIVLLDGNGAYGVAINHRVKLAGSSVVTDRVIDEQGLENAGGGRTGVWVRSGNRIVLYPPGTGTSPRNADLSDTSFVHGLTAMTLGGARFLFR
jgi:hypothetical protein